MRILAFAMLFSLLAQGNAPKPPTLEYVWSDGDAGDGPAPTVFMHLIPGGALTVKLLDAQGTDQKASADSKMVFPQALGGETKKGRWSRTGKTITFTIEGAACKYQFAAKVVVSGDEAEDPPLYSGPGLKCAGKETGRPAYCACPLIQKNLNATYY